MKLLAGVILALSLLARCGGEAPSDDGLLGGPVPQDTVMQQAACEKSGGRWGKGGMAGFFVCYRDTRDAGKSCKAATDCEGLCLARSRSCAPVTPLFGCQDILDRNGRPETICID